MKCPECGKEFKPGRSMDTHRGMAHPDSKSPKGPTPSHSPASTPGGPGPEVRPGTFQAGPFYPTLESLKAPTPAPGLPPATMQAAQVAPIFDSSPLWKGAAEIVNVLLEAMDSDQKIEMTDARALALDASIKQAGFQVEQRQGAPIVIPWYAPFLITFGGTFGLPIVAAVLPRILKMLEERKEKAKEDRDRRKSGIEVTPAGSHSPVAEPVPEPSPATIPYAVPPEAPAGQVYREPGA